MSGELVKLAAIYRDEAHFWVDTPEGSRPGSFAYYAAPLLLRLADSLEASA